MLLLMCVCVCVCVYSFVYLVRVEYFMMVFFLLPSLFWRGCRSMVIRLERLYCVGVYMQS